MWKERDEREEKERLDEEHRSKRQRLEATLLLEYTTRYAPAVAALSDCVAEACQAGTAGAVAAVNGLHESHAKRAIELALKHTSPGDEPTHKGAATVAKELSRLLKHFATSCDNHYGCLTKFDGKLCEILVRHGFRKVEFDLRNLAWRAGKRHPLFGTIQGAMSSCEAAAARRGAPAR